MFRSVVGCSGTTGRRVATGALSPALPASAVAPDTVTGAKGCRLGAAFTHIGTCTRNGTFALGGICLRSVLEGRHRVAAVTVAIAIATALPRVIIAAIATGPILISSASPVPTTITFFSPPPLGVVLASPC